MCSVLFSFLYVFSAFTGSVDGCINFFNNDGVRELSVKAFQHSISVMKCVSGRLVGGSYEGLVKVGECEYIDRFVSSITSPIMHTLFVFLSDHTSSFPTVILHFWHACSISLCTRM